MTDQKTIGTPQQKMHARLSMIGVPFKEIECFGKQIIVTTVSLDSSKKWQQLLRRFAKVVRRPCRSIDDAKNSGEGYGKKTQLVWRVSATV